MPRRRVLVVNPTATQDPGVVGRALESLGCEIDHVGPAEVAVDISPDWPKAEGCALLDHDRMAPGELLPHYDGLVVLGGSFSVRTIGPVEGRAPPAVVADIEGLIRGFHAEGKPVLGLCLGSQLIARAFGADVYKLPADEAHTAFPVPSSKTAAVSKGQEYGFLPQLPTAAAATDAALGPALAISGASLFEEWHEDSFELPEEAVLLTTRSSGATNQCFRIGDSKTYGFQYHIEVGEDLAAVWHRGWVKMWSLPPEEEAALAQVLERQIASGEIGKSERFVHEFVQRWIIGGSEDGEEEDGSGARL